MTDRPDQSLIALLAALERRGYDFVTPLNSTIRRMRARTPRARDLRGALGWSLPFGSGEIDEEIEDLMTQAGVLEETDGGYRATVRVSRVQGLLFLHSAFPAEGPDAVFLGPDSYRFAALLDRVVSDAPPIQRLWDVGAGPGIGGVVAARITGAPDVVLSDVNGEALRLARANAAHAGVAVSAVISQGLDACAEPQDLIVANPPFIASGSDLYSDGGGDLGAGLSIAWADQAMDRLAPGGRLVMYTGSAIVDGRDTLRARLAGAAEHRGLHFSYQELDPDIFPGELDRPEYAAAERIAAVAVIATRPA